MSQTFFTYKEGISKFYNCLNNVKGSIKEIIEKSNRLSQLHDDDEI